MKKIILTIIGLFILGCGSSTTKPVNRREMLKPAKTTIVNYFYAPWCPPCKAFAPIFEKWKQKYTTENITFVKINTDENKDLASRHKVSALPTIVVTVDEQEVGRFVGVPREEDLVKLLK